MGGLESVKRLYLDYLNAGFKKEEIARKLKSQFKDAKFTFKGATLYVAFGLNPPQKVLGMELNAATRLIASKYALSTEEQAEVLRRIAASWSYDSTRSAAIEAAIKGQANPKQVALIIETLNRCVTNLKGNARDEAKKALRTI